MRRPSERWRVRRGDHVSPPDEPPPQRRREPHRLRLQVGPRGVAMGWPRASDEVRTATNEPHRHHAQHPGERQVDSPTQHACRHDDGARALPSHGLQLGDVVSSALENRTNGGGTQRNALHASQERRQATNAEVRAVDVESKHGPLHGARGAVVPTATCGPWASTPSSETAQHARQTVAPLDAALSSLRLVDCTR